MPIGGKPAEPQWAQHMGNISPTVRSPCRCRPPSNNVLGALPPPGPYFPVTCCHYPPQSLSQPESWPL